MNPKNAIALYGYGYVGKAVFRFLKDHYDVHVVDPFIHKMEIADVKDVEINRQYTAPTRELAGMPAVICVPTPMKDDGSCDTSIVEEILRGTEHPHYLVKSTVKVGTTDRLAAETGKAITFSPEYIGEGKYEIPFWKDLPHPTNMKLHSFHIFGGPREETTFWVQVWQRVAGWSASYHETERTTAELVKYAENMFLATKKIFFDELFDVAGALGVPYNELKELLLLDGRIGRSMTLIFPESRGFTGKCLPKDTSAIVDRAREAGYEAKFWKEVIASNKRFRGEPADVEPR